MKSALNTVVLLAACFCLLCACSSPAKRGKSGSGPDLAKANPSRPEPGKPINPVGMLVYMEREVTNLVQEGKINFDLLQTAKTNNVALNLVPPSSQSLALPESSSTLEMSVAVVGRIIKRGKTPVVFSTCTGFFITESGALVTCRHVLNNGKKPPGLAVMTRDGRVRGVTKILCLNEDSDLVILQVDGHGFKPLPVASNVKPGAAVWVLSHPWPWFYMLTSGIVSGSYDFSGTRLKGNIMAITADFANGSSGAPVFNQNGEVVGIANFTHTLFHPDRHDPQMSTKGCIPSTTLLQMIHPD